MPTNTVIFSYAQSTILLIAGGTIMLVMLVVSSFKLSSETNDRAIAVETERSVRTASRITLLGLLNAETGQRGFILTGEEAYLTPYDEGIAEARRGIGDLQLRVFRAEDQKLVDKIEPIVRAKLGKKRVLNNSVPASVSGLQPLLDAAADSAGRNDCGGKPSIRFRSLLNLSRRKGIEPPGDIVADIGCDVVFIVSKQLSRSAEGVR